MLFLKYEGVSNDENCLLNVYSVYLHYIAILRATTNYCISLTMPPWSRHPFSHYSGEISRGGRVSVGRARRCSRWWRLFSVAALLPLKPRNPLVNKHHKKMFSSNTDLPSWASLMFLISSKSDKLIPMKIQLGIISLGCCSRKPKNWIAERTGCALSFAKPPLLWFPRFPVHRAFPEPGDIINSAGLFPH